MNNYRSTVKFGLSEKHSKCEKNLPHGLYIYLVNVRKIFSHFECFPESPNFTEKFQPPSIMKLVTKDVSYFIFFNRADVLFLVKQKKWKIIGQTESSNTWASKSPAFIPLEKRQMCWAFICTGIF